MRTDLPKSDEGGRDKPRTQREIMMEIIEKNKSYREERRREMEAMTTQIDDVDAMMDDLQGLLHFRKVRSEGRSHHQDEKASLPPPVQSAADTGSIWYPPSPKSSTSWLRR